MGGDITVVNDLSTGFTYQKFSNVTVNSMGIFFNAWDITARPGPKALPNVADYTAGTAQARIAELLHELGHMVLTKDANGHTVPLLPFENGSPDDRAKCSRSR